jgi:class 3 adenylate cyclase
MRNTIRDSTRVAARLDAEEWRDLVGAYLDAASAVGTRYEGDLSGRRLRARQSC